jgi:hypothetical protein
MVDCTISPDDAVRSCLDRLRHRRDDIAFALDDRSLRVRLDFGDPEQSHRITFTREGHVMSRSGSEFHPHVELHGPPRQVLRFLTGRMSLSAATLDGIVTLHVSSGEAAEYGRLRALVAEELANGRVVAEHRA